MCDLILICCVMGNNFHETRQYFRYFFGSARQMQFFEAQHEQITAITISNQHDHDMDRSVIIVRSSSFVCHLIPWRSLPIVVIVVRAASLWGDLLGGNVK